VGRARDVSLSPSTSADSDTDTAPLVEITAKIGCLPSQHVSNRGLMDRLLTLWGSWSVESGGKKVYFAG
jgi:L-ascorbate metabolism protein UlaG (beta-lactamase superfamily)